MLIQAGVYRFAMHHGHARQCSKMMHSFSNARTSRKSRSAALVHFSNTLFGIIPQRNTSKYSIQPIAVVIPSRNFMNIAPSAVNVATTVDTSSTNTRSSNAIVLCLDLECGKIDGDDDG